MTDPKIREQLRSIKTLIKEGQYQEAFAQLAETADPLADFSLQHRYIRLLDSIPTDHLALTPLKIGLAATSSIEHFSDVFRFWMTLDGFYMKPGKLSVA